MRRFPLLTISILLILFAVSPVMAMENRVWIVNLVATGTPTTSAAISGTTITKAGVSIFKPVDMDAYGASQAGFYFRDIKVNAYVTNYSNSGASVFVTAYWTPNPVSDAEVKALGGASQIAANLNIYTGTTRVPIVVDWVSDKRTIGKYLWFAVENLSKVSGVYVEPEVIIRGSR